jgi:hypothetical protein
MRGNTGRDLQDPDFDDGPPRPLPSLHHRRRPASVPAVDHRFALSKPAFLSAGILHRSPVPGSSPIFGCSVFRSGPVPGEGPDGPTPNTLVDPSCNCSFHAGDLRYVNAIQLRQLRQHLLAL